MRLSNLYLIRLQELASGVEQLPSPSKSEKLLEKCWAIFHRYRHFRRCQQSNNFLLTNVDKIISYGDFDQRISTFSWNILNFFFIFGPNVQRTRRSYICFQWPMGFLLQILMRQSISTKVVMNLLIKWIFPSSTSLKNMLKLCIFSNFLKKFFKIFENSQASGGLRPPTPRRQTP